MQYKSGMTLILEPSNEAIARAADILKSGGLVGLPTETVYGLAADAENGKAVARIYEAKARPAFNPLIVHVADIAAAERVAVFDARARVLAAQFWPGPLTLVLPLRPDSGIDPLVTAGLETVAVRMPAHKVAQDVLRAYGKPLAAPSANPSGGLSPTSPAHVAKGLGEQVGMILAGGRSDVGLESTVIDVSGDVPFLLRHGAVTRDVLASALDTAIAESTEDDHAPKSPGQTLRHYAPSVPLRLKAVDVATGEALLAFGPTRFMSMKEGGAVTQLPYTSIRNLSEEGDLTEAAANLFRFLHDLDQPAHKAIAVMDIPDQGLGRAINDRLKRGAQS